MKKTIHLPPSLGRLRTCDVAYPFVMPSGFAGDVNRGHPASIEPCLIDPNAPPTLFGQAVLVDATTQGVRPVVTADLGITQIWGVTVRPYPFQQPTTAFYSGAVGFGAGSPAQQQPVDILTAGYIIVPVFGATLKGGAVYIWTAASGGGHIQGGFEAGSTGGSTSALDTFKYAWNSPPDADGLAELKITF